MPRGRPRKWITYTDSCSGCYETKEGYTNHDYPTDPKLGIKVGAGCNECGYTGKRKHQLSVAVMAEQSNMPLKEFLNMMREAENE